MRRYLLMILAMLMTMTCAVAEMPQPEVEETQPAAVRSVIPWAELYFGMPQSCFEELGLPCEEELAVITDEVFIMQSVYVWGTQQIGPAEHTVRCWIGVELCVLDEVSCEAFVTGDDAVAAWDAALALWSSHFGVGIAEQESGVAGMYSAFAEADGVGVMISMEGSDEFGYVLRTHIWPLP